METSRPQGTDPSNDDRTRSQLAGPHAATLTAGFEVDATKGWSGPLRMRDAPAGYDLFRYLGGGGMGEVYVAREHAAERVVAIKFLRPTSNPALRERFLKEVRALGRVEHPHVVRMISVDLDRSDPFYTMEYASAGTIADRIKAEGPYSPDEAARIGAQLAGALSAVHEANIFHRDIKPSNVVLTVDGVPKLSDFGLAKLRDAEDELTRTTQAIGTPAFMPPEQISRKFGEYGPATDVYGLGATLYAMLTGKAPFEGDSHEDIISKVRTDDPVRPRSLRPDLPTGLEAVVMKCLEKRPANRYGSSDELANDLNTCLAGGKPPPATWWRRTKRWLVRNSPRFLGIAIVASLSAVLIALGVRLARPETPLDPCEEYRLALRRGATVTLIGETGVPRWYQDRLGAGVFGVSPTGDGTAYFESFGRTAVLLIDDPGIEHYAFQMDIRQVQTIGKQPDEAQVGPLFGYSRIEIGPRATDARPAAVDTYFDVGFQDGAGAVLPQPAHFQLSSLVRFGDELQRPAEFEFSSRKFDPVPIRPGRWRTVKFEIDSSRVRAWWGEENQSLKEFPSFDPLDPTKLLRQHERGLNESFKTLHAELPKWRPGMPLGFFVSRSAVSIRNCKITPLP